MSVNLNSLNSRTYKELQEIAKICAVPANIKRELLVKGIKAFYEKDQKTYDGLLSEVRSARFKRKKPKTAVTSRSRRQSKGKRSLTDNSDDIDVLGSGDMKDLVPSNQYLDSNRGSDCGMEQSGLTDRLYQWQHPAYLVDNAGHYGSRPEYSVNSPMPSNQLQSNYDYMSSSSAVVPYNGSLAKDGQQDYPEHSPNHSSYASLYYRQPCPSFSWIDNPSSFISMQDNFYASQLPSAKLFDPKVLSFDGVNHSRDQSKMYLTYKSGYYDTDSNGAPPAEMDCCSDLLPNIPLTQLESGVQNHANESSSWGQNAVVPAYPNRVQFSPENTYSYQENEYSNGSYYPRAADNESISAEVDSGSETDNHSLAEDLADLLSMSRGEQDSTTDLNLRQLVSSDYPREGQSSSTAVGNERSSYYVDSNRDYYANVNSVPSNEMPRLASWSHPQQNVGLADGTVALPGSQTAPVENGGFQLPAFSTFMYDPKSSTTDHSDYYSNYQVSSQEPRDLSFPGSTQQSSNSTTDSCPPCCSQQSGYEASEGTSSSSNEGVSRQQQFMDSDVSYADQSRNECLIVDLDSPSRPQVPAITAPDTTFAYPSYTNGYGDTNSCYESDQLSETRPNHVASTTGSLQQNEGCNRTSEASGLIYEKETLHRSKIICDPAAKKGIIENYVHKFEKIFIPNDSKDRTKSRNAERKNVQNKFQSSIRNFQILRTTGMPVTRVCWYKSVGCAFEAKADVVATHEKKCKFQTVYCPSESCSWRESFHALSDHIAAVHRKELFERKEELYKVDRATNKKDRPFYTFYQMYNDIIYVIRLHIDEDKCVATVQYIPDTTQGDSIRTRNVEAAIRFVSFPDKHRVNTWKGTLQRYSDTAGKCQMQIDVKGSSFIVLYVCIC